MLIQTKVINEVKTILEERCADETTIICQVSNVEIGVADSSDLTGGLDTRMVEIGI